MAMFERPEQNLFRKILSAHSKTPIESIYLELGVIPFRFHLMARRITYYQTILKRDDEEITKKVIQCQKQTMVKGDFYPQVSADMIALQLTDNDLTTLSNCALKKKLHALISKHALKYLLNLADSHSKVRKNLYTNLNGMEYFKDSRFTSDCVNILFQFRTRMFDVKNNFRNNYKQSNLSCPLCEMEVDTQEHLFECQQIRELLPCNINNQRIVYENIFSNDCDILLEVAKLLKRIVKIREDLMDTGTV